ncbi:MAG: hypothetical protein IPK63_10235 [Candidatus Competibacteraceae bacterium]|nr:hypothetical protein [Candidatus Competibacteraceae bacterium]
MSAGESLARWCASEPPDRVALALETLQCLADASPPGLQPIPDPQPLAWLVTALDRLECLPEPLPIPPHAPSLAWRYLLLTRVLGDELEMVYTAAWRHGWATRCPWADGVDGCPPARVLACGRDRDRLDSAGLAALTSGVRLPLAGLQLLYAAHDAGVDWSDSTAFWRLFNAMKPPSPVRVASTPDVACNTLPTSGPTEAPTPSVTVPLPVTACPALSPNPPAPPVAEATATVTDPWRAVVRATLATLIASPRFNHMAGMPGSTRACFRCGKAFAETLYQQPWVRAGPAGDRKALYRHLAAPTVDRYRGTQRIWSCYVSDNPAIHPRYVSALKIASTVAAGLVPCPAFPGRLWPANGPGRPGRPLTASPP